MHMYAKCDQNIPCGPSVTGNFTNCLRTDSDSHSDYSADLRVVQYLTQSSNLFDQNQLENYQQRRFMHEVP